MLAIEQSVASDGNVWFHIPDGWILSSRAEGLSHDAETYTEHFNYTRESASSMPLLKSALLHKIILSSRRAKLAHRRLLPELTSPVCDTPSPILSSQNAKVKAVNYNADHMQYQEYSSLQFGSSTDTLSRRIISVKSEDCSDTPLLLKVARLEEDLFRMHSLVQQMQHMLGTTQELFLDIKRGRSLSDEN